MFEQPTFGFFVKSSGKGVVRRYTQIASGRSRHCIFQPEAILMNETKIKRLKNRKQSLSTTVLHADRSGLFFVFRPGLS